MNTSLHRRSRSFAACVIALVSLQESGCTNDTNAGGNTDPADNAQPPPVLTGNWLRPSVGATWQWQLQPDQNGMINSAHAADVYDIDLFNSSNELIELLHRQGRIVIGYFSAGTYEDFRPDSGQFSSDELGKPLEDFADERWLDVRSENVRRIVLARLDLAAQKGFDGVEPDNVDGYANDSGFDLSAADQLAFNRFIANEAHLRGLSVGLKNDLDQIPQLVDYFDFAVNEQCHQYEECDLLQPFIAAGKPVFNAEYAATYVNFAASRAQLCEEARNRSLRTLVLPIALDDGFRFSCD